MAKHRTQLLLDPDQYESLASLAADQQRSISDLVREFVGAGLAERRQDRRRRLEALEGLAEIRQRIEGRVGRIAGDPITAVRAERERQADLATGREVRR
jgi:hypothetical protein